MLEVSLLYRWESLSLQRFSIFVTCHLFHLSPANDHLYPPKIAGGESQQTYKQIYVHNCSTLGVRNPL